MSLTALGQSSPQPQQPAPATATRIEFYVTANAPLAAPDLTITVDKQPAQVASVRSAKDDPLLFVILLDVSASQKGHGQQEKAAAWKLFQNLSVNGNRGVLAYFNTKESVTRVLSLDEARSLLSQIGFDGGSSVFDAVAATCAQLQKLPQASDNPRKVVILLSDGDDNQSHVRPDQAEEVADDAGIAIFSLSTGQLGGPGQRFLRESAQKTGGQAAMSGNLKDDVDHLLKSISGQLAVRIVPTQEPDHKRHSITVKSAHRDGLSAPATILLR